VRLLNETPLLLLLKVLTHLVGQGSLLKTAAQLDAEPQTLSEMEHLDVRENFVMLIIHNTKSN
jgi:precorrin-6B methylase 2